MMFWAAWKAQVYKHFFWLIISVLWNLNHIHFCFGCSLPEFLGDAFYISKANLFDPVNSEWIMAQGCRCHCPILQMKKFQARGSSQDFISPLWFYRRHSSILYWYVNSFQFRTSLSLFIIYTEPSIVVSDIYEVSYSSRFGKHRHCHQQLCLAELEAGDQWYKWHTRNQKI